MHTFIIAEIGINHNGSVDTAKKLILTAKEAGCDIVKFQKRSIDKVYSQEELNKYRESPWGKTNRDQKQGLEFGAAEYDVIDNYCQELEMPWFVSCWDLESYEFMKKYQLAINKVASAVLNHEKLIRAIAQEGKLTYISTGMSTMVEISQCVHIFNTYKCPYVLMHCNSQYPMPDEKANLNMIRHLEKIFKCPVGYSGHEVGIITSIAAVCYGAVAIERHITLDRAMYGSDQAASLEPQGLKKLVEYIRVVEKVSGDTLKYITPEEEIVRKKLRRLEDY